VSGRITAFCSPACRDAFAVEAAASGVAELVVTVGVAAPEDAREPAREGSSRTPAPPPPAGAPTAPAAVAAPEAAPAPPAGVLPAAPARGSLAFWLLLAGAVLAVGGAAGTMALSGRAAAGGRAAPLPAPVPRARPAPPPATSQPEAPEPAALREAALRALRAQLGSTSPVVRLHAAVALAPTRSPEAMAELARTLDEPGWPRRMLAAGALAPLGHEPAQRLLRSLAAAREPRETRLEAARLLARSGDPAARTQLRRALAGGSQRLGAAEALARLGDPAGLDALREALRSTAPHARLRAAVGLAQAGDFSGAAILEAAVQSERLHVGAAGALARRGDARARARLVEALDRAALRVDAARALRSAGPVTRAELGPLWRALGAGDELARISAAEAILIATAPAAAASRPER
jgi:HEAT repeat protein